MPRSPIFSSAGQCSISNHPSSPPLSLPFVIFPVVQEPKPNTVSRYRIMSVNYWGIILCSLSSLCSCPSSPGCLCPLCCQDTQLAHAQLAIHQDPQALFHRDMARLSVVLMGVSLCQGQDLLFSSS